MDIVDTKTAATILGISPHGVRKMIERGQLPAKKFGRGWVVSKRVLARIKPRKRGRPTTRAGYANRAEYKRQATARRHQTKKRLIAQLTPSEWSWLLEQTSNRCVYCGRHESECGTLNMEHIIPVSQGGSLSVTNIVPACRSCNSRKGSRSPEQAGMQMILKINPLEHMKQAPLL